MTWVSKNQLEDSPFSGRMTWVSKNQLEDENGEAGSAFSQVWLHNYIYAPDSNTKLELNIFTLLGTALTPVYTGVKVVLTI